MKNNYDFSKGVKNPYLDKLKDGYTIAVHYDFIENDSDNDNEDKADKNGGPDKQSLQKTK